MKPNTRTVALVTMFLILLCVIISPASAKTYYTFAGHPAVRYEHSDITPVLRPYVDHVEYDLKYNMGSGCGVRFYYTQEGRKSIAAGNRALLDRMTNAVMTAPEWKRQRSYISVWTEIWMHAKWERSEVHIEYNYVDLQWWEEPYRYM